MDKKGFTLVELLAVIAILAILVIIALPNVLKMFNNAKKNSFLTETKTIYNNASSKYITENLKGNKLDHISSNDNTKLEMTGEDLIYYISLNDDGSVKSMKVYNGTYYVELKEGEKITDLSTSDIEEKQSDYVFEYSIISKPVGFEKDSWSTIKAHAEKCVNGDSSCIYHFGDAKKIDLGKYGTHWVRIANISNPSECSTDGFSQTACGFVIEFTDSLFKSQLSSSIDEDGWPGTDLYKKLNDTTSSDSVINSMPKDLSSIIMNVHTVTSFSKDTKNYLYLLSEKEVYGSNHACSATLNENTRQLDFYNECRVSSSNQVYACLKKDGDSWWLRSIGGDINDGTWVYLNNTKYTAFCPDGASTNEINVSPAFRIY